MYVVRVRSPRIHARAQRLACAPKFLHGRELASPPPAVTQLGAGVLLRTARSSSPHHACMLDSVANRRLDPASPSFGRRRRRATASSRASETAHRISDFFSAKKNITGPNQARIFCGGDLVAGDSLGRISAGGHDVGLQRYIVREPPTQERLMDIMGLVQVQLLLESVAAHASRFLFFSSLAKESILSY